MRRSLRFLAILVVSLVLALGTGCSQSSPASSSDNPKGPLEPAQNLGSVEIAEYRGQALTNFHTIPDVSISGPQTVDIAAYRLAVDGVVQHPQSLTYAQVLSLRHYQKLVTLHCVEGWNATGLFEGVLMKDLLKLAGPLSSAVTVIFHGADQYTTSLPLATVLDRNLLLAYRVNNGTLVASNGFPFILVAEDKLGYKWCQWVVRIELSTDANYKGTWERQGYGNDADINTIPANP